MKVKQNIGGTTIKNMDRFNSTIRDAIKEYKMSQTTRVELIRESVDNVVFLVEGKEKKILRISKRSSAEDMRFEYEAIAHLRKSGFSAARWNKTVEGKLFIQNEGRVVVLFDFIEGYQVGFGKHRLQNRNECYAAGEELARLHNAGRDFPSWGLRRRTVFTEMERAIGKKEIIGSLEGGREFIRQLEEMMEFGKGDDGALGIIHNDYRPGNVIFRDEEKVGGVIDFDWSCQGPIIKDLALAVLEWSFPEKADKPDFGFFDAFLKGYNDISRDRYDRNGRLFSWIRFAAISDAATYLCDFLEKGPAYEKKTVDSYMYKKYLFFSDYDG